MPSAGREKPVIVTALNPYIGYKIATQAVSENRAVKEIVLEEKLLSEDEVEKVLAPDALVS